MTPEEGYREAEQRIELARQEGATELDLRNLAFSDLFSCTSLSKYKIRAEILQ